MKTVLVTGATRGIGLSIAKKFAKENWTVVACGRSEVKKKARVGVDFFKADITKKEDVQNLFSFVKKRYGKIDALVNNAGIVFDRDFCDITREEFFKTIETNVFAAFELSRLFAKIIKKGGSIVNMSSTNGTKTISPECLDYNISKIGLQSLTRDLAFQFRPNIRVNAVAPGWVDTQMNAELPKDYIESETSKIWLGRFAKPEEIASLVFFLASEEAGYINGEVINIDGGM